MKKLVVALFLAAAIFATLAVPAFAQNLGYTLSNRGTSTCVNYHATNANRNHDSVEVYPSYCSR